MYIYIHFEKERLRKFHHDYSFSFRLYHLKYYGKGNTLQLECLIVFFVITFLHFINGE